MTLSDTGQPMIGEKKFMDIKIKELFMRMTEEQEEHLLQIKESFYHLADTKYRAGQAEHGGNLFDMSAIELLDNAIDEAVDQVVYLLTLRSKVK